MKSLQTTQASELFYEVAKKSRDHQMIITNRQFVIDAIKGYFIDNDLRVMGLNFYSTPSGAEGFEIETEDGAIIDVCIRAKN